MSELNFTAALNENDVFRTEGILTEIEKIKRKLLMCISTSIISDKLQKENDFCLNTLEIQEAVKESVSYFVEERTA